MEILALVLVSVLAALLSVVVEALALTDDNGMQRTGWFANAVRHFQGPAWARIVASTVIVGGSQAVAIWATGLVWLQWVSLIGIVAILAMYTVCAFLWFDRPREVFGVLGLYAVAYYPLHMLGQNIANADAVNMGVLPTVLQWATIVGAVAVTARVALCLYHERSNAPGNIHRPSAAMPVVASIAVLAGALAVTSLTGGALALPAGLSETPAQAEAATGEGQVAVDVNYQALDTWCDLEENLRGTSKEFWVTDNSQNEGLDGQAFKNSVLNDIVPTHPAVGVSLAWAVDEHFDMQYINAAYSRYLPTGNATTTAEKVNALFEYFILTPNKDAYQNWVSGPVGFLTQCQWTDEQIEVQVQTAVNRYAWPNPQLDVLDNASKLNLRVAHIHGELSGKGKTGDFDLVKRCCNIADDDGALKMTPKSAEALKTVSKPSGTTPSGSGSPSTPGNPGTNPGTPDNPTPTPTPTPTPDNPPYDKRPEDSNNWGQNDDPGPGPDTNTGVGSTTGADDRPWNSGGGSYEDYQDSQDQIADANDNAQHQTETGNAPSYQPPAPNDGGSTTVDNNANNPSNPGGTVDTPSQSSPPVQAVQDDPPAQQWSGPAD